MLHHCLEAYSVLLTIKDVHWIVHRSTQTFKRLKHFNMSGIHSLSTSGLTSIDFFPTEANTLLCWRGEEGPLAFVVTYKWHDIVPYLAPSWGFLKTFSDFPCKIFRYQHDSFRHNVFWPAAATECIIHFLAWCVSKILLTWTVCPAAIGFNMAYNVPLSSKASRLVADTAFLSVVRVAPEQQEQRHAQCERLLSYVSRTAATVLEDWVKCF